ncbi:hypothetical protein WG66_001302 [Moniliophthora roreri]|nr:hypothetical protein WG66_001302 [Moniliophthora roreri]
MTRSEASEEGSIHTRSIATIQVYIQNSSFSDYPDSTGTL